MEVGEITWFSDRRRTRYSGGSDDDRNRVGMRESGQSRCGSLRGISYLVGGHIACWLVVVYNIRSKVGGRQR